MDNIQLKTTVHDCTIIKVGGSWAITLPIEQMKKAGFQLGMWVQADLSFDMERDSEPLEDNTEDIRICKEYLKDVYTMDIDDLDGIAEEWGLEMFDSKKETEEEFRKGMDIEIRSNIKYLEKEQKRNEKMFKQKSSDYDYDKSGKKTIGLKH